MAQLAYVNGTAKPLVLVDGTKVRRKPLPQFAGANRTEGRRSITSISNREEYAFPVPIRGIGKTRIVDVSDKTEFEYCTDATAMTRYKSGVYLPTLSNTATAPSNPANVTLGACKAMVVQGTTPYGYWSGAYDNGAGDTRGAVYEFSYSGGSWNNGATQVFLSAADANTTTAIAVHAATVAVSATGTRRLVMFSAWNTATSQWVSYVYIAGGAAVISYANNDSVTWDQNMNGGKLLVDGATVWAAIWSAGSAAITIYKSTDGGATFGAAYGTITSSNGPTGLALYENESGTRSLMVGSAEGVWAVNTTTFAAALVSGLDFRNNVNTSNCAGMVAKQGSLYVPRGSGYGAYVKVTWDGNWHVDEVGPGARDGLPVARQGAITAVCDGERWTFWAAGGLAASKNASVFSWDPVYDGLHSEWLNGTANRRIDAIAIASGTLHVCERTGTNTTVMRYHDFILDDPAQGAAVKYESSGYVQTPQFDGGFAADNASWEDTSVECDALTATADATSGIWIADTYDPDGSGSFVNTGLTDSAGTSATNFLSGQKTLYWGALLGKSAVTMAKKLTLNRGTTNTLTPKLHTLTLGFKKRRKTLYQYEMDVDRVKTAQLRGVTVTAVDAEITALLPPTTIVKVSLAYGLSETTQTARRVSTNCYMLDPAWADDAGDAGTAIPTGAVRLFMSEG